MSALVGQPLSSCLLGSAPGWPLVLYFHHVHPAIDHYTSLTPAAFTRGLDLVLDAFEPAALESLMDADGTVHRIDRPAVLMTFDDGYADLLDTAVPALAERGVRAVFFVCTDLLGQASADPRASYLSWSDCADLLAAGHSIGSHGRTHRPLTELAVDEAGAEVTESLDALRRQLDITRAVYAYPYGLMRAIPARVAGFAGPVMGFGTVKAAPLPWPAAPRAIRRTYLPTGAEERWEEVIRHWRSGWDHWEGSGR
jgi:peptidoglycan/xylan/chitin deacetylase (PgdA/CDA1 family)